MYSPLSRIDDVCSSSKDAILRISNESVIAPLSPGRSSFVLQKAQRTLLGWSSLPSGIVT